MALKDWKKVQEQEDFVGWDNLKNNQTISIEDELEGWGVILYGKVKDKVMFRDLKTELTKSQALVFAKDYMRSH